MPPATACRVRTRAGGGRDRRGPGAREPLGVPRIHWPGRPRLGSAHVRRPAPAPERPRDRDHPRPARRAGLGPLAARPAAAGPRPHRPRGPRCSRAPTSRGWWSSAAASHRTSTRTCGPTAPWSSPPTRRPRSTPTARRSTSRTSCTPGSPSAATSRPPMPRRTTGRATPRVHHDAFVTLLRAIHDDSVTDALDEFVGERPVVGVMGGHALARGTSGYAVAARLGHSPRRRGSRRRDRRRARRHGGRQPGRLRAGRGGARGRPRAARRGAVLPARHRAVGEPGPPVHDELMEAGRSPSGDAASASPPGSTATSRPTCSATASRSTSPTRSARTACWPAATAGLVVLEGAAGTVQEIFQAATPLYYARRGGGPRRRSCWSATSTGPSTCRCGQASKPWPTAGACSAPCTSSRTSPRSLGCSAVGELRRW